MPSALLPGSDLYPGASLFPSEGYTLKRPLLDRPHFAFPFTRGEDGQVNKVDQDTTAHIMSCETVIASCPLGFRDDRPEFGWPWPEFRTNIDPEALVFALRQFEPRSSVTAHTAFDLIDASTQMVDIEVQTNG